MTNYQQSKSGRTHGVWTIVLSLCGIVASFGNVEIYVLCSVAGLIIWVFGCDKRNNTWTASFKNRPLILHMILMLLTAGALVGHALGSPNTTTGAFLGLTFVIAVLGWDLMLFDTEENYQDKISRHKRAAYGEGNGTTLSPF